jgi:uncharacterized phiE125 gp8 family phage protein
MADVLVQPPIGEPITLAEAKLHLRVTEASQDTLISAALSAVRQAVESKTRRQLLHARWKTILDRFPGYGMGPTLVNTVNVPAAAIALPHSPVVNVVSVRYLDMSGVWQTVDPSVYAVNKALTPAIVVPVFGQIWPIPVPQVGAVEVVYDAGYASPVVADGTAHTLTSVGSAVFAVDEVIMLANSGGILPTGVAAGVPYKVATASAGVYTLKTMSGVPVTISGAGTGTHFMGGMAGDAQGVVPEGIRAWMLLRLGALYENREEVALLNRGTIAELPFVDALLDPYRTSMP